MAASPEKGAQASWPVYPTAIMRNPIPAGRLNDLIGLEPEIQDYSHSDDWESRNRDSAKEPGPKWDGKVVVTA
eukprot:10008202-Karenia_brevis.AAC.1